MTHCLRFRHRLIPYLYTMSVRAAKEGRSLVEPMYYDHPSSPDAYKNKNQYLFGSELLVSPITTQKTRPTNMGSTETWLPKGRFVDIFTGTVYDGDRIISMHRPTDGVPVLAAEGAILPLDNPPKGEFKNGTPLPEAIELVVVVGKDGHFELLEDDGSAEVLEHAVLARTSISYNQATGEIKIGPTENPLVKSRKWSIQLPGFDPSSPAASASSEGRTVSVDFSRDPENGHLCIVLDNPLAADKGMTIKLGKANPQLRKNDTKARIREVLERAQMQHDTKWALWNAVEEDLSPKVLISRLRAIDVEEEVMDAMMEFLLAQE